MTEATGAVPEWRVIYDQIVNISVDGVITYTALDAILGRKFVEDRAPIYKANRELLEVNKRTLVNVPRVGYRVGRANEHADLAIGQRRRARRAMSKGVRLIDGADRRALTRDENQRLTTLEVNYKQQANILRQTTIRVDHLEKADIRQSERMDLLERALRRQGLDVPEPPA